MKGMDFRGMKDGTLFLNLNLEIENPNDRQITIKKIHFKAWIKERELGKLINSKKIVLKPHSKEEFQIPIEIKLRAAADIFKLMTIKEKILDDLTIEGYIKGCAFPVSKKIRIEKQPFTKLISAFKDSTKTVIRDSVKAEVRDSVNVVVNDSLKIE
jgi:LEA14-like dessication related protein